MPRTREFKKLPVKEQVYLLLTSLNNAIMEHPELHDVKQHKTDLIGIACQYRKSIKREDFEEIKDMTVQDIIDLFNDGY
jgi:hypothetical protein